MSTFQNAPSHWHEMSSETNGYGAQMQRRVSPGYNRIMLKNLMIRNAKKLLDIHCLRIRKVSALPRETIGIFRVLFFLLHVRAFVLFSSGSPQVGCACSTSRGISRPTFRVSARTVTGWICRMVSLPVSRSDERTSDF